MKKYANLNELAKETSISIVKQLPITQSNPDYVDDFTTCLILGTELYEYEYKEWQGKSKRTLTKPREMSLPMRKNKARQAWGAAMNEKDTYKTNLFDEGVTDMDSDNYNAFVEMFFTKQGQNLCKQMTDMVVKAHKLNLKQE